MRCKWRIWLEIFYTFLYIFYSWPESTTQNDAKETLNLLKYGSKIVRSFSFQFFTEIMDIEQTNNVSLSIPA